MLKSMVTAFRTLTVIPFPGRDCTHPASSLPFFPVVGAFIGAILYLVIRGSVLLFPGEPLIGGLVVTVTTVLITGALHIDGLADLADAFGGGGRRERILAILKDSRHGTFGVTAITTSITGKILLIAWCLDHQYYGLLVAAVIFSRTIQAWGCSLLPYALPEGGGTSVFFSGNYGIPLAVVTIIATGIGGWIIGPFALTAILLLSLIPVLLFFGYSRNKIGGLTGDCLGAANEIGELAFLFCGAVCFSVFRQIGL